MPHSPPKQANERWMKPSDQQTFVSVSQMKAASIGSDSKANSDEVVHPLPSPAHTLDAGEIVITLNSHVMRGLSTTEVEQLLQKWGPNRLKPPVRPSLWKIFLRQIANAMTIVLIAAMAVSLGTFDYTSGGVIAALVILNVATGTVNEWKAEKTVAALESVGSPVATVVRHVRGQKALEGKAETIQVEGVVPGDIILVRNGDIVPADARIIPGFLSNLQCDEALLTGESMPVQKTTDIIKDPTCPVGDRTCMVFAGSQVVKGRARCIVTSTGMITELGKIAAALQKKEATNKTGRAALWHKIKVGLGLAETTPLQVTLNKLAYFLLFVACILAVVVVATTAFRDVPLSIATYAVATSISLLPASLVAVVSLTLANASRELAKRKALVRRMDAVETLSAVDDVCSDKTGTITVGRMVLKKAWVPVADANPRNGKVRAPINTRYGQSYVVESGSDPYFPRGFVNSIPQPLPRIEEDVNDDASVTEVGDEEGDSSSGEDVNFHADTMVHANMMEVGLRDLVICGSLCNTASIHHVKGKPEWEAHGDPTEVALQVFVSKLGHGKPHLTHPRPAHNLALISTTSTAQGDQGAPLERIISSASQVSTMSQTPKSKTVRGYYEMLCEHPFDSSIKRMSTAWIYHPSVYDEDRSDAHVLVFMKGATERVLDRCSFIGIAKNVHDPTTDLTEMAKRDILGRMDELASEGLRVLSLCGRVFAVSDAEKIRTMPREDIERDLGFLGLVGIYDPPRPESAGAVQECMRAGIVPRMLTGDHERTALAIAKMVGIIGNDYSDDSITTGQKFDAMTNDQIDAMPNLPLVIARCAPETKVRMVEALHRRKRSTIMTGDGVNDSPALKRADVGVAMGQNGSDVAKQAADIVLADDNFSTIVRAVRKGRSVFQNLAKFLMYLLSGNLAEIVVLLIGLSFKDQNGVSTFPVSPVAAMWINTLAAGPPALALGLEPTSKDVMNKPPSEFKTIFTLEWYLDLFFYGFLIGGLALVNFVIVVFGRYGGELGQNCNERESPECRVVFRGRACCFSTLVVLLMFHAFHCKNLEQSLFKTNILDNKVLLWSAALQAVASFALVYIPVINDKVFLHDSMGWEWGLVFAQIIVYWICTEVWKFARRVRMRNKGYKVSGDDSDEEMVNEKGLPNRRLGLEDTIPPPQ